MTAARQLAADDAGDRLLSGVAASAPRRQRTRHLPRRGEGGRGLLSGDHVRDITHARLRPGVHDGDVAAGGALRDRGGLRVAARVRGRPATTRSAASPLANVASGGFCSDTGQCAPGLACNHGPYGGNGTCGPKVAVGGRCELDADCVDNTWCHNQCTAFTPVGTNCQYVVECGPTASCATGVCEALGGTGSPCTDSSGCLPTHYCSPDTSVCTTRIAIGGACPAAAASAVRAAVRRRRLLLAHQRDAAAVGRHDPSGLRPDEPPHPLLHGLSRSKVPPSPSFVDQVQAMLSTQPTGGGCE